MELDFFLDILKIKKIIHYNLYQSKITSLWLLSNYIGAFLSSLAGGVFYDLIGFSWSCTVLASIIAVSVRASNYFINKGTVFLSQILFYSTYIFATQYHRPLIFHGIISVRSNSISLKYQRFLPSGC